MKARHAAEAATLEDIPNIGPSIAGDLRGIGIATPQALVRQDPRFPHLLRQVGLPA